MRAVEVAAKPARTTVMRASRRQKIPVVARAMEAAAVAAIPTTIRTHQEEDAGGVVRIESTALPLSPK
jgi:hypothetical protein